MNKQGDEQDFFEQDLGTGDQAIAVEQKPAAKNKSPAPTQALEQDIRKIISEIETSTGKSVEQSLISLLEGETVIKRKIAAFIPKASKHIVSSLTELCGPGEEI